MTPLPPHIPGVVIRVPLDRLIEYLRVNNLQAAGEQANPARTLPVIVKKVGQDE